MDRGDKSYRYQYEYSAAAPAAAAGCVPAPRDVSTGPRNSFQPPRESFARPSIPNNAMIGGIEEPNEEYSKKGGFASRVMSLSMAGPESSNPRNTDCGSMVWPSGTTKSVDPKSTGARPAYTGNQTGVERALQARMPLSKAAERRNDKKRRKVHRCLCFAACVLFLIGYGSYAGTAAADLVAAGEKLANSEDVEVRNLNVSGLCTGTISLTADVLLEWESFSSISVGDVCAAAMTPAQAYVQTHIQHSASLLGVQQHIHHQPRRPPLTRVCACTLAGSQVDVKAYDEDTGVQLLAAKLDAPARLSGGANEVGLQATVQLAEADVLGPSLRGLMDGDACAAPHSPVEP